MKSIVAFLLTKTKILRLVAFVAVGWLISAGVIKDGDKSQVGEALAVVLVGAASLLIEHKKDNGTKVIQEEVGAKPDGWAGPQTHIEVRKAITVQGNPAK